MQSFSRKAVSRLLTQQNTYHLYLHEYQAYDLLKKYHVPLVPVSSILFRASEPTTQKMLMQFLSESWHQQQKPNHLLTSS